MMPALITLSAAALFIAFMGLCVIVATGNRYETLADASMCKIGEKCLSTTSYVRRWATGTYVRRPH